MEQELFQNESTTLSKVVNVSSVPQRSPFRYPGGKTWFVPTFRKWISFAKAKPTVLLEPFAGGGIIGLTAAFEGLVEKVVLVELDQDIAAVWQTILSNDYSKLACAITEFQMNAKEVTKAFERNPRSTFDRAFQCILRNRVSHGGIMAPGSGLIKNGENGKGISSRWYPETLATRINAIGAIRDKITFIHASAFEIVPDYLDDARCSIFLDPPYTAAGKKAGRRLYVHHKLDHEQLFGLLQNSIADFVFTYDESAELREMAESRKFQTALVPMKNTHHARMNELIVGKNLKWLQTY